MSSAHEVPPIACRVSFGKSIVMIKSMLFARYVLTVLVSLSSLGSVAAFAATDATDAPACFTHIRTVEGISEYRLDANGLTILLLPDHSAPAVTMMVTYHVGSRNESYGTTGATHLLEHLMFKGTREHNKENGTGYGQLLEHTGRVP